MKVSQRPQFINKKDKIEFKLCKSGGKIMKRTHKATLLSTLFMGLGQLYNRDFLKGIVFMIIEAIALINIPGISHGIWGLVTLGDTPQQFVGGKIVQNDHSIFLLTEGLIVAVLLAAFALIYIYNIKDAKRTAEKLEKGGKVLKPLEYINFVWTYFFPQIMMTPAVIAITFFIFLPILITMAIAFTNYSIPHHVPPRNLVDWVGINNFIKIFKLDIWNNTFVQVGLWTIIWAIASTFLNYFTGLGLALLTNAKGIKFRKMWRTIFLLPYAIPGFISLLIFRLAFSGTGPINAFIQSMGLAKIPFFTDPTLAKLMVIVINMWLGSPYFMVLMAGVLTNIPQSMYEAANIDGANKWKQFINITLPMVFYQTLPLLIMTFAYNFNNFNAVYLLTDGNPINANFRYAGSTDILITWVYKMTRDQSQFHMASVITIILFIFVAGVSGYSLSRSKAFKEEDML